MSKEPRDGGADVEAVYAAGFSGNSPSPYLTPQDLKALAGRCRSGEKVICNIEAFEIEGDFDVARLDLGLYGEDPSHKSKRWEERVADSIAIIDALLAQVVQETNPIMFVVWLDTRLRGSVA